MDPFPRARAAFLSSHDLLHYWGENIQSRASLYNLCLVSRVFYASFVKFLYRRVVVCPKDAEYPFRPSHASYDGLTNEHFSNPVPARWPQHARELVLWNVSHRATYPAPRAINKEVQEFLQKAPGLTTLECHDSPLYAETLDTLHACCPNLANLTINSPGYGGTPAPGVVPYPEARWLILRSAAQFANLTRLHLHFFLGASWPSAAAERKTLARMLAASPGLKELGLGMSNRVDMEITEEDTVQLAWLRKRYIYDLCQDFAATGSAPLELEVLELGAYLSLLGEHDPIVLARNATEGTPFERTIMWLRGNNGPATYLSNLCRLEELVEVRVGLPMGRYSNDHAWCTFGPDLAPKLRRLVVQYYERCLHNWLLELAREDRYRDHICPMVIIYSEHERVVRQPTQFMSQLLAGGLLKMRLVTIHPRREAATATGLALLCRNLQDAADTIEGLWVRPSKNGLDLFPGKELPFILPLLPKLKALRVHSTLFQGDIEEAVKLVAGLSLTLLFILVRGPSVYCARKIVRDAYGTVVDIEPMESWEVTQVELFSYFPVGRADEEE